MNLSTECLEAAQVELLLQGNLTPLEYATAQEHLEVCEQCRARVEEKIGPEQWWGDVQSVLLNSRSALFAKGPAASADAEPNETPTSKLLDLLGPTDDPHMLGRIGCYEIVGLLGQGGMGAVFKGFDRSLNRFVAIKMLLPHLAASGAARKRFAREGQAVAAVVDDHVMAIHCVDEWQGVPYLVMTYSRGVSLQKRLSDNGPLEVREILRIGMQAAKGLAAAHAQGIVHRDIKPANIFLDQNVERVQLMDFGLARAVDDASLTRSGTLAGTPQYMSPEQARAETVDHRSDLFSLGSVLYAMCTGHAPFRAESSYSVLRLITDKEPRSIREINPDIPEWLCAIISKLMAKNADDRFASAQEVAALLEECLAHVQQPTTSPLPFMPEPTALAAGSQELSSPEASACGSRSRLIKWLVGSAAFAFLAFAGVLIVLETNKGTLTIESEANDVPIRITQGDQVVKRLTVSKGGKSVRIAAGAYVLEIDGEFDGLSVRDGRVSLNRGTSEIVTIIHQEAPSTSEGPNSELPGVVVRVPIGTNTEVFADVMQSRLNALRWHSTLSDFAKDPVFRNETPDGDAEASQILRLPELIPPMAAEEESAMKRWLQSSDGKAFKENVRAQVLKQRLATQRVGSNSENDIQVVQVVFRVPAGTQVSLGRGTEASSLEPEWEGSRLVSSDTDLIRLNVSQWVGARTMHLSNFPGHKGLHVLPELKIFAENSQTKSWLAHNAIPLAFTNADIDHILTGERVTKVIYKPSRAYSPAAAGVGTIVSTELDPGVDPYQEASRRGEVLAMLEIEQYQVENSTDVKGMSLADGVRNFNLSITRDCEDLDGWMPPITDDEIVAWARWNMRFLGDNPTPFFSEFFNTIVHERVLPSRATLQGSVQNIFLDVEHRLVVQCNRIFLNRSPSLSDPTEMGDSEDGPRTFIRRQCSPLQLGGDPDTHFNGTPLARALAEFNTECSQQSPNERPVTPSEVAAALKLRKEELEINQRPIADEYLTVIEKLIKSGDLPTSARFDLMTELGPFDGVQYRTLNIDLRLTKDDGIEFRVFPIRRRFISSAPVAIERVSDTEQAFDTLDRSPIMTDPIYKPTDAETPPSRQPLESTAEPSSGRGNKGTLYFA